MEFVLRLLTAYPGPWAFALLLSCGLGGPPWSEEIVLLGSGYFVAQGDLGYLAAVAWCWAGLLAGDSFLYFLGRRVGERVYRWPLLRRKMGRKQRARFNRRFQRDGTKAVFVARFLPGFRMVAYFVAGNLGMPYWKFFVLDSIGAALTVPISVWLGGVFAENLEEGLRLLHRYQVPAAVLAGLGLGLLLWRRASSRRLRLLSLRRQRRVREAQNGPDGGAAPR